MANSYKHCTTQSGPKGAGGGAHSEESNGVSFASKDCVHGAAEMTLWGSSLILHYRGEGH